MNLELTGWQRGVKLEEARQQWGNSAQGGRQQTCWDKFSESSPKEFRKHLATVCKRCSKLHPLILYSLLPLHFGADFFDRK